MNLVSNGMKNFNRKDLIIVIVLAVIVLAVILAIAGVGPFLKVRTLLTGEPSDINLLSNQDAYHVALEKALAWQLDAKLASMKSALGETGVSGRSDDWDLLFVSKSIKKKGFHIVIRGRAITVAEEINFTGQGMELPTNTISSQEAVAKAHDIPGYEKEPVLGVEMVYGPDGSVWYWGVKTARGTITINAKKK